MAIDDYEWDSSCNATGHIYSFMGDFNDVCSVASNELCSLGYIEETHWGKGKHWRRSFHLAASQPNGFTKVIIRERQMLNPRSTAELVMYKFQDGWISVEIIQAKSKPRWQLYANRLLNRIR